MSKKSNKTDLLVEKKIGLRLRSFREQIGLSRELFARKIGTTAKQIERYEKHETEPGFLFLDKLVEIFDLNPVWLLTGEGPMFLEKKKDDDEIDLFLKWLAERKKILSREERYRLLGRIDVCFPEFRDWLKKAR